MLLSYLSKSSPSSYEGGIHLCDSLLTYNWGPWLLRISVVQFWLMCNYCTNRDNFHLKNDDHLDIYIVYFLFHTKTILLQIFLGVQLDMVALEKGELKLP